MSIDAIGSIGAVGSIGAPLEVDGFIAPSNVQATDGGFGVWFANEVASVNAGVTASDLAVKKLVTGEAQSLHDVMIKMEEAKLSFQLLAQVRNRLLDAYQEVMRMQV